MSTAAPMANDEALVEIVAKIVLPWLDDYNEETTPPVAQAAARRCAENAISALRAAGHLPPPGAVVIPALETDEIAEKIVNLDLSDLEERFFAIKGILRAAGERS